MTPPLRAALCLGALVSLLAAGPALGAPQIELPPEEEGVDLGPDARPAAPDQAASAAPSAPTAPAAGPAGGATAGVGASPATAPTAGPGAETTAPGTAISTKRTSLFGTLSSKVASIVNRTVLGGYGEFVLNVPETRDSYFEARRLVLFLYSPIHPRITFSTEIETEFGGTPVKQDGQLRGGEVILEFAVLDFKLWDWLNLRGGVILVPFGKFNVNHDSPTRDLTDRPLLVRTIIPSTWFESGAGLFGSYRRGPWELNYEAYFINGLDSKIQDGLGNRPARGSLIQDNNNDKAFVGRIGTGYFGRIRGRQIFAELGVSGYTGEYDRRGARSNLLGVDLTLRIGRFEILGEYVRAFNDPGFDDDYSISSRLPVPRGMQGFYVQANYHFMPRALRRILPEDLQDATFTGVILYEEVDTDTGNDSVGDRSRLVLGLNFRPIEPVVWKHEVQFNYTGQVVDGRFERRSFFGAGLPPRPSIDYVTSLAFLF